MKNKLLLFIAVIALSCQSDNESTDKKSMTLITGINLRQNFDDFPIHLGNPNTYVNNKFLIYPNPAIDSFVLSSNNNFTDVWIVPAKPEKIHQNVDFGSVLNSNLYSEQTIISKADFKINVPPTDFLSVEVSTLKKGYYKVFVKIDGIIYWDNLYKCDENSAIEAQTDAVTDYWK